MLYKHLMISRLYGFYLYVSAQENDNRLGLGYVKHLDNLNELKDGILSMATHTLGKPKVFRNFCLSPELDLYAMRFRKREGWSMSKLFQQALLQFLTYHAPELKPDGPLESLIYERWESRVPIGIRGSFNGPSDCEINESSVMRLLQELKGGPKPRGRRKKKTQQSGV